MRAKTGVLFDPLFRIEKREELLFSQKYVPNGLMLEVLFRKPKYDSGVVKMYTTVLGDLVLSALLTRH